MNNYRNIAWWYWAITVPMLGAGLYGFAAGFYAAMALTALQILHFGLREQSFAAFPVQVRMAYLGLLLLGTWWPFYWVYWLQLVGTSAMVLFDYCLLARIMSLMPWNRTERFSLNLVTRTFFSPPVRGNVLQGLPAE